MTKPKPYSASRLHNGQRVTVTMTQPPPERCSRVTLHDMPHVLHVPQTQPVQFYARTPVVGSFVPSTFSVTGLRSPLTVQLGVVPVSVAAGQFAALQLTAVTCATGLALHDVPLELLRSLAVEASLFTGYLLPRDQRARRDPAATLKGLRLQRLAAGTMTLTSPAHVTYAVGWAGGKLDAAEQRSVQRALDAQRGRGLSRDAQLRAVTRLALSVPYRQRLTAVARGMGRSRDWARKWVQIAKRDPVTRAAWRQADRHNKRGRQT